MTQHGLFGGNYRPATDAQKQREYQSRIFADGKPFIEDTPAPLLPIMIQQDTPKAVSRFNPRLTDYSSDRLGDLSISLDCHITECIFKMQFQPENAPAHFERLKRMHKLNREVASVLRVRSRMYDKGE